MEGHVVAQLESLRVLPEKRDEDHEDYVSLHKSHQNVCGSNEPE